MKTKEQAAKEHSLKQRYGVWKDNAIESFLSGVEWENKRTENVRKLAGALATAAMLLIESNAMQIGDSIEYLKGALDEYNNEILNELREQNEQ